MKTQRKYQHKANRYVRRKLKRLVARVQKKYGVDLSLLFTLRTEDRCNTYQILDDKHRPVDQNSQSKFDRSFEATLSESSESLSELFEADSNTYEEASSENDPPVSSISENDLDSQSEYTIPEHIDRLVYLKIKRFIGQRALQDVLGVPSGVGEFLPKGLRAYKVEERAREIHKAMESKIPIQKGTKKLNNGRKVKYAILALVDLLKFLLSLPEYASIRSSEKLPILRISGDGRHSSNKCNFTLFTVTILPPDCPSDSPFISRPEWCISFAVVQAKEGDDRHFGADDIYKRVMKEINHVIHNGINMGDYVQKFEAIFCSDWKFLSILLGIFLKFFIKIYLIQLNFKRYQASKCYLFLSVVLLY